MSCLQSAFLGFQVYFLPSLITHTRSLSECVNCGHPFLLYVLFLLLVLFLFSFVSIFNSHAYILALYCSEMMTQESREASHECSSPFDQIVCYLGWLLSNLLVVLFILSYRSPFLLCAYLFHKAFAPLYTLYLRRSSRGDLTHKSRREEWPREICPASVLVYLIAKQDLTCCSSCFYFSSYSKLLQQREKGR